MGNQNVFVITIAVVNWIIGFITSYFVFHH